MTYTLDFLLGLGSGKAGLSDLRAQLFDTAGSNVGSAVSTGFVEIGSGNYLWHYASIPDAHRGGVKFYSNATPATILAANAINPQEAELAPANLVQIDGKDTDGGPAVTDRPKLYLKLLDLTSDDSAAPLLIQNTTGPTEGPAVDVNGYVDIAADAPGIGAVNIANTTASGLGGYGLLLSGLTAPMYPDFIGADGDTLETLSDQLDVVLAAASTSGSGSSTLVYTVTDTVTGLPLADCKVWVTTDLPGNNIAAGDVTTTLGVVTLFLDPGTYYVWLRKAGHTFVNPDTVVVT